MAQSREKSNSNRRDVLKGLGMGTLALPLVTEGASAKQGGCNLSVTVEPGEGNADNWTPRERLTDEFKGRIDVSGFSGTHFAYMMVVLDPDNELIQPRSDVFEVNADWTSAYVVDSRVWDPTGIGPLGEWQNGRYNLHATVIDEEGNFGGAVSNTFEIRQ